MRLNLLYLILLGSAVNGCVDIKDSTTCTVAGVLSAGAICSHTLTAEISDLNFDEFVTFLEPQDDRGGAICMSARDWGTMKTELEEACRQIGAGCTYQVKQLLKNM